MSTLTPLPPQPAGVPWPTRRWPPAKKAPPLVAELIEAAFDPAGTMARTYAVVVVQGGRLLVERYGGQLPHLDRPAEPVTPDTALLSWSMAKSFLHALVGVLVGQGRLDPAAPPPGVPWRVPGGSGPAPASDPRRAITVQQMLEMRDGLDFNEDYVDDQVSDTIAMLFGPGRQDVAGYAASRPRRDPPGKRFSYSSGTSNLLAAALKTVVGPGEAATAFAREHLFGPIGMTSARLGFDDTGTWVASSYLYATARDYARFGLLYLRDGAWEGRRLLPEGWVDHGRWQRSVDPVDGPYGAHWWVVDDGRGTFWASGYHGQCILVCPGLDVVVVRLGDTPEEGYPSLVAWRQAVLDALEQADPAGS